jgi:hypothetical protein
LSGGAERAGGDIGHREDQNAYASPGAMI